VRNRHHADCRVAVERAADRYTLICDGPVFLLPSGRRRIGHPVPFVLFVSAVRAASPGPLLGAALLFRIQ